MNDLLLFVGLIAGWIVLNVWVLPLFGIQTCMSGACRVPPSSSKAKQFVKEDAHEPSEPSRL